MSRLTVEPPSTARLEARDLGAAPDLDLSNPAPMHAGAEGEKGALSGRAAPSARVNLMPPEVIVRREIRRVKRRTIVALVLVVAVLVAAFTWFKIDESRAQEGLAIEKVAIATLGTQQLTFAELLRIETSGRQVDRALARVMKEDVAWDEYLVALTASAPSGIEVTGVDVMINDVVDVKADAPENPSGALDPSGQEHIGSLTVTGFAPSHEMVTVWADSLTAVEGFLVPYILDSSVLIDGTTTIQFAIEITLSSTIRSLRYGTAAPTTPSDASGD